MSTVYEKEKIFWNKNVKPSQDGNEIFFEWYDEKRFQLFSCPGEGLSLEIGPGTGHFSRLVDVEVTVDFSLAALLKLKKKHNCLMVVADAGRLPFKDGVLKEIYANDVMHHLKAESSLEKSCLEIKRVLSDGGYLYVSDRAPVLYNSFILSINKIGRFFFKILIKILRKQSIFSGSENEPPMTKADYQIIARGLVLDSQKTWRSWPSFWIYFLYQVLKVILPDDYSIKAAHKLVGLCDGLERISKNKFKADFCLTYKKESG